MAKGFQCSNCSDFIIIRFLAAGQIAKCLQCQTDQVVPNRLDEIDEDVPRHPAFDKAIPDALDSPYSFSEPVVTDSNLVLAAEKWPFTHHVILNPCIDFWRHPRAVIRWAINSERITVPLVIYIFMTIFYTINTLAQAGSLITNSEVDFLKLGSTVFYSFSMAILSLAGGSFLQSQFAKHYHNYKVPIEHIMIAIGWGSLPLLVSFIPQVIWMLSSPDTYFNISGTYKMSAVAPFLSIFMSILSITFSVWGVFAQLVAVSEALLIRKRIALTYVIAVAVIVVLPITVYGLVFAAKN